MRDIRFDDRVTVIMGAGNGWERSKVFRLVVPKK
jgi:hypothetical protein